MTSLLLRTDQGYVFKNLVEILYANFKDVVCLEFTHDGIFCEQMTSNNERMIKFTLYKASFGNDYEISAPFLIGLQLRQFFNTLKSIKKRDHLMITIEPCRPSLIVTITTPDQRHQVENVIPYYPVQQLKSLPIDGFSDFIPLSIANFMKLARDLNILNSEVRIKFYGKSKCLQVSSSSCDIAEKTITMGTVTGNETPLVGIFAPEFLGHLNRLNYITQNIKLYFAPQRPLYIKCAISDLGELQIYLKPTDT